MTTGPVCEDRLQTERASTIMIIIRICITIEL